MTKGTQDGQNVERVVRKRYAINSGQDSIHGSTLFQTETQESQSFGFYASTGQGASEGSGPGTGKAVLYTPGMSQEILGQGLKVRGDSDNTLLLAKLIECEKGEAVLDKKTGQPKKAPNPDWLFFEKLFDVFFRYCRTFYKLKK